MYQRSLLGPAIQSYLQSVPLSVLLKPRKYLSPSIHLSIYLFLYFLLSSPLLSPPLPSSSSSSSHGYSVPTMNLPQNDFEQTSERHRILEITQIQYNYTGMARFGGYFGEVYIL